MIKDIAGISEPLKRLIEVVAEGIGGVSRPILTRKNADAKAYEIKTVAQAITESQNLLGPIKYVNGEIVVASDQGTLELPEAIPDLRVVSRVAYQEAKRQSNLEQITQNAAKNLEDTNEVSHDLPDSDWTARFFRIAEDITTEEMQGLWGKVLAGEVRQPGSFSMRTLDVLKNISQKEAETFARVTPLAIDCESPFILYNDNGDFLKESMGIFFGDLMLLREIGLITDTLTYNLYKSEEDSVVILRCSSTCVLVERPARAEKQSVKVLFFTEIGTQLLQLIDHPPANPQYIKKLASAFYRTDVRVKTGVIISRDGNTFHCRDLQEFSNVQSESD